MFAARVEAMVSEPATTMVMASSTKRDVSFSDAGMSLRRIS